MAERRPVPGRRWGVSEWAVDTLIRMGITPNQASVIGMVLGILSGLAFYMTGISNIFWLVGAVLVFLRSAFNIFDGMIADKTGNKTASGVFLNDFTDRIADAATLIGLGYARFSSPVLGYLAAVMALLTALTRLSGKVAGSRMHYGGIMSKPVRMYLVIPTALVMAFHPIEGLVPTILIIIAVGSAITVVQRAWWILKELS